MSLINTTVWATVSMSTIQATPIWQKQKTKYDGNIPSHLFNNTVRAALIMLGMSETGRYSVEKNVNIRSNNSRQVVYANTTLYTFPVAQDCAFKRVYQNCDILHFGDEDFTGWGVSHIKMDDFGNEHDPSRESEADL